ncbi:MAG: Lrp/AsnC family transcriptional regulator [Candidatus Desulforudis sp.]|nr:Lrp/AsnC family transcriptional regulator [Desulforudis sp.]
MQLDNTDRRLLEIIQRQIPLSSRPFADIGVELGIGEGEVLERLRRLQEAKIIRRIGGFFDSRKLGYTGTLCALQVPRDRIEEVAAVINAYSEVSHNYLRTHEYNMWFTILAPSQSEVERVMEEIKARTGIDSVLSLPAERLFKIRVKFNVSEVPDAE